jgi:hypothetical protein
MGAKITEESILELARGFMTSPVLVILSEIEVRTSEPAIIYKILEWYLSKM